MLELVNQLRQEIETAPIESPEDLETFRVNFLGRKSGRITDLFKQMRHVSAEDRPAFGQEVNALKELAEQRLDAAQNKLTGGPAGRQGAIDLTLPGRKALLGARHPLTHTFEEIQRIFERFGFSVAEGPEIEDDWHNFTALNFPPDHPARDMQDTFFLREPGPDQEAVVLRTHTSPVQIRVMKTQKPPVRVIVPGRVYRNESISYKSYCVFHQVEGLYVDEGVSLADLKQVLHMFARAIFGEDVRTRFRPSFFPFTEPSAEFDIWMPNADLP
jgi:phenylalanyl-tRNA synthetase alpha chain